MRRVQDLQEPTNKPEQRPVARKTPTSRPQTGIVCPRCGRSAAHIIGQSDSYAVLYLRCDECHQTSIAPA